MPAEQSRRVRHSQAAAILDIGERMMTRLMDLDTFTVQVEGKRGFKMLFRDELEIFMGTAPGQRSGLAAESEQERIDAVRASGR